MDYQLYENSDILLNDNSNSRHSWSMESNGDLFEWNPLKIDEEEMKVTRKRKLSAEKMKQGGVKMQKDPLSINVEKNAIKKNNLQKAASKMPHWQVEDYDDINADLENTLALGSDLVSHSYNVSDSILSINGMAVFKQEAPSPTSNDNKSLQQNRQSPTSTQNGNITQSMEDNCQNIFNNTINQLLNQSGLANLHNVIDNNNLSPSIPQENYVVSSTNYNLIEDCRFQYVLAAATSIATKQNEDTLTYLNQGQSYEIRLKKLGDLSLYRGKLLKSVIRICFHERRLQYMEKEQMLSWQKARPGDRILEVDVPLSYGAHDVVQPSNALNLVHFNWDPTKEVGIYIKVNCISTEFTPKKHGGEKGVPFRIQVETYQSNATSGGAKRVHAAACQIKVFKLKGADRKHKQDKEKIMKRPVSEQEKYQPSYECTVLNDLSNDAVLVPQPESPVSNESSLESNPQLQAALPSTESVGSLEIGSDIRKSTSDSYEDEKYIANNLSDINQQSSPEETQQWLTKNRFEKYVSTFENFSGDDMLRMTRADLMQICGNADGIRLHNAIHLKTVPPKLKIFVCRENASVYNAIFLSSYCNAELLEKLSLMIGVSHDKVRDIYIEGPQSIHVHLTNDVLKHIKEETMFSLEVMQDNNSYIFILKGAIKK